MRALKTDLYGKRRLTDAEHEWAQGNAPTHTAESLADEFERRFGWRKPPREWHSYCYGRLINLKRRESDEPDRGPQRERAWLCERVALYPPSVLLAMFEEEFGWRPGDWAIREMAKVAHVEVAKRPRRRYPKVRA